MRTFGFFRGCFFMRIVVGHASEHELKANSDSLAHLFLVDLGTCLRVLIRPVSTLFDLLLHAPEDYIGRLFILLPLGDCLLEFVHVADVLFSNC